MVLYPTRKIYLLFKKNPYLVFFSVSNNFHNKLETLNFIWLWHYIVMLIRKPTTIDSHLPHCILWKSKYFLRTPVNTIVVNNALSNKFCLIIPKYDFKIFSILVYTRLIFPLIILISLIWNGSRNTLKKSFMHVWILKSAKREGGSCKRFLF